MDEMLILIAEDDADDRFLLKNVFEENKFLDTLHFVENGVELLNYLTQIKNENSNKKVPRFILLDLNMPKKDGREVLGAMQQDTFMKNIPVVVFSTTGNETEKAKCFELGAHSYITKPVSYEGLLKTIADVRNYWYYNC